MSCSSSVIQLQLPASGQSERAPVHLLPCELEHNGPAQIMEYFSATVKDHKHGIERKGCIMPYIKGALCNISGGDCIASLCSTEWHQTTPVMPPGQATSQIYREASPFTVRMYVFQEQTVSFRGRGLKGQEVSCPQRCTGLVLKEVNRPGSEEEDRTVRVTSMFDKLTYWNLETPPSSDDTIVMAMDWPELAEAIHGPVD